jgi:hypothetical protein
MMLSLAILTRPGILGDVVEDRGDGFRDRTIRPEIGGRAHPTWDVGIEGGI